MKRADLYKLVWEKPVTHVAREFGISDVAIRKIYIKHGIPTPPLGYWAKLQHGKRVKQEPLPALKEGQSDDINLFVKHAIDLPKAVTDARRRAMQEELQEGRRISVPAERPEKVHPLAIAMEKVLRKAKPNHEGFVGSEMGAPGVHVGKASIDRVVLLMHTIFVAVTARGYELTKDGFAIVVEEQPLALRIYETKGKRTHVPSTEELKRQAKEEEWRSRVSLPYRNNHKVYPIWEYFPSGRLAMEISDPKQTRWRADPIVGRWYDRSGKSLESDLSDMMVALKTGAANARHHRAQEAEEARIAKAEEERCREQEIQRRLLEKVTTFLMERAEKCARLEKLERLAAYLKMDPSQPDDGENADLYRALEFALVNMRVRLKAVFVSQEIEDQKLLDTTYW